MFVTDEEIKVKNRELFFREKETLDTLLAHGAITKAEHERSMRVLVEKLGTSGKSGLDSGHTQTVDGLLE